MANGITYGINFPFRLSQYGYYFDMSDTTDEEVRSALLHLILTKKGERYFLPDFGTRIYEFIFDPFDGQTFDSIKDEVQDQVEKYLPFLTINEISVKPYLEKDDNSVQTSNSFNLSYDKGKITYTSLIASDRTNQQPSYETNDVYRIPGANTQEYTAVLKIDYTYNNTAFSPSQTVTLLL